MIYADPFLMPIEAEEYDNFRTMDPALLETMANYQTPEEKKREYLKGKGRNVLDKIGQGVNSLGGFEAIGSAADQIRNLIGGNGQVADSNQNNTQNQILTRPAAPEEKQMPVWVKGTLIGLGIGACVALAVWASKSLTPA